MGIKIEKFDKPALKFLRAELQSTLDLFKEEYGITLTLGNIRFSASEFKATLEGKTETKVEQEQSPAQFAMFARVHGLPEDCRGKNFLFRKNIYTIEGFNSGKKKYNVSCRRADGKVFGFQASHIALIMQDRGLM